MLGEAEGAGADRVGAVGVAELLGGLAADDVAAVVVGNPAQEVRVRVFEGDADGERVDGGGRVDTAQFCGEGGAFRVRRASEGVDDVVGRERAPVALEVDSGPEMENPGLVVGRDVPAGGEVGLEVLRVGAARLEADQGVVDPADGDEVVRGGGPGRVERDDVGAVADHEGAGLCQGGCRWQSEAENRGEADDCGGACRPDGHAHSFRLRRPARVGRRGRGG